MKVDLRKHAFPVITGIVAVLAAIYPLYGPVYSIVLLASVMMYVVLAMSWSAFCVPTNYTFLGTAAIFGIGIYTSALLQDLPFPLVIIIGGVLGFLVGLIAGAITLRLRGMYFCIFTFSISELIRSVMMWYEVNITGAVGRWLPLVSPETIYYYMLGLSFATFFILYFFRKSKWGLALETIGQSEEAAAHMGINVNRVKILSFALICFFIGAAGSIMAARWSYIDPDLAFSPTVTFLTIMMVLAGGSDSRTWGPILGAVLLSTLSDTVLADFPNLTMMLLGIILLVIILFFRGGILGEFGRLMERYKRGRQNKQLVGE